MFSTGLLIVGLILIVGGVVEVIGLTVLVTVKAILTWYVLKRAPPEMQHRMIDLGEKILGWVRWVRRR